MEQHSNDQQTGLWARLKERAAAWNDPEARQQRGRRAGQRRRLARDWARIHLRRAAHRTHGTLASQQAVGPASFLVVSAALGVALTLTTLYAPSYAVTVDGEQVGVVSDREVVDQAIADFPATTSLRATTLIAILEDILSEFVRSGSFCLCCRGFAS